MFKFESPDGQKHWGSLSPDQVREIRAHLAEGKLSQIKISEMYNVSHPTISYIKTGKRYGWVV